MKKKVYPYRDPIKNSFIGPNELFRLGLSYGAIAVYIYLLSIEDRESHECWPAFKTIGSAVGMSENTVRKYVTELEEGGLLWTEPTVIKRKCDGRERNGSLKYHLRPIQEAVDLFHERQFARAEREMKRACVQKKLALMNTKGGNAVCAAGF